MSLSLFNFSVCSVEVSQRWPDEALSGDTVVKTKPIGLQIAVILSIKVDQ